VAEFSHLDHEGAARMVDVGEKAVLRRTAVAGASVRMSPETVELLREKALPKGDALNTARIAGDPYRRDRPCERPHRRRDGGPHGS
jgi:cyclic pyranopterin phosphate synthase